MHKQLFALLTVATTLLLGAETQANQVCLDGVYVGALAGGNFITTYHKDHKTTSFNGGYLMGANVGYELDFGCRLEGEFAYRHNTIEYVRKGDKKCKPHTYYDTFSLMANGYRDFNVGLEITPYVGLGIGYAWNTKHVKANHQEAVAKSREFAWQAMVGGNYELCENTTLSAEYRFFKNRKHCDNHSVLAAIKYAL
jgi:opacity protein-like surface antigen